MFVFVSAYDPYDTVIGNHLVKHGDGAKDIAFEVEDLDYIVKRAKEQGAIFIRDIWSESDEFGTVRFATVKTVSIFIQDQFKFSNEIKNNHVFSPFSMVILHTRSSNVICIKVAFCLGLKKSNTLIIC